MVEATGLPSSVAGWKRHARTRCARASEERWIGFPDRVDRGDPAMVVDRQAQRRRRFLPRLAFLRRVGRAQPVFRGSQLGWRADDLVRYRRRWQHWWLQLGDHRPTVAGRWDSRGKQVGDIGQSRIDNGDDRALRDLLLRADWLMRLGRRILGQWDRLDDQRPAEDLLWQVHLRAHHCADREDVAGEN